LTLNILFSTNIEELLVKGLRNHLTSLLQAQHNEFKSFMLPG